MVNLIRRSFKDIVIGAGAGRGSKPDSRNCRKHPKHQQSPGVCSLCLSEKLSQLSGPTSSSRSTINTSNSSCSSSSSLSSYYSSASSATSCSSPKHPGYGAFRTNQTKGSLSFLFISGKQGLKKSRSIAIVPRNMRVKSNVNGHGEAKKGGLLSKLLSRRRRKNRSSKIKSR